MARQWSIEAGQASVNPIRDKDDLYNCINFWKRKRDTAKTENKRRIYDRNYLLFLVGINTALRFSDLRRLTVEKVKNNYIYQRDKKTGKENKITLNNEIYKEVMGYIKRNDLIDKDYLFYSSKGVNKPLTRVMGYNLMQQMKKGCKLSYNIGTHTLRKTYGYWFYQQTGDIVALQAILNHSTPAQTLIYIGMQQKQVDEKRQKFVLM